MTHSPNLFEASHLALQSITEETPEAVERQREKVLFPANDPYSSGFISVSHGHRLWYAQHGNAKGLPVVVLHGGPGTGTTAIHPRLFDPSHYRIVLVDQRGAGRSQPPGRLEGNTTGFLVDDLESLRTFLRIEKWLIFGSSWGSMLGVAYGITHPDRCLGFALHGIALPGQERVDWWSDGLRRFAPEKWQAFAEFLPESEREHLLDSYYARLMHEDPLVHMPAARAWTAYEAATASMIPMKLSKLSGKTDAQILAMTRIGAHYAKHRHFLEAEWFFQGLRHLGDLPAFITHGRWDLVCTPDNAYELARHWRNARLSFVEGAGHTYREPNNAAAIVRTTEEIKSVGLAGPARA